MSDPIRGITRKTHKKPQGCNSQEPAMQIIKDTGHPITYIYTRYPSQSEPWTDVLKEEWYYARRPKHPRLPQRLRIHPLPGQSRKNPFASTAAGRYRREQPPAILCRWVDEGLHRLLHTRLAAFWGWKPLEIPSSASSGSDPGGPFNKPDLCRDQGLSLKSLRPLRRSTRSVLRQ